MSNLCLQRASELIAKLSDEMTHIELIPTQRPEGWVLEVSARQAINTTAMLVVNLYERSRWNSETQKEEPYFTVIATITLVGPTQRVRHDVRSQTFKGDDAVKQTLAWLKSFESSKMFLEGE